MPISSRLTKKIGLIVPLLVLFITANWIAGSWVRSRAIDKQILLSRQQLQLYVSHLNGQLEKYRYLPTLLATNRSLAQLLLDPDNESASRQLNHYLETINNISGASDAYLMDRNGLTLAASNWHGDNPFIGRNFSYRPYFQQAMQGRLGRYFALGITSQKRGYYFAYPISRDNTILGTVVIKIDIDDIEKQWRGGNDSVLVTDLDDIIFISSEDGWRYKSLTPLASSDIDRVEESGRYPGITIKPVSILEKVLYDDDVRLVRFADRARDGQFLMLRQVMPSAGWNVYLLTPSGRINRDVMSTLAITSSVFVVLLLIGAVLWQRQRQRKERTRHALEAQRALQLANDQLEMRVEERTVDLRHEIDERHRAEQALRLAQDGLVQAGKLAMLGQMSAGITHELNQPLTAIQSYADNARLLFERGRYSEVGDNLEQINELIGRMAQISSQLKLFARKSDGQRRPVSLRQALDVSLKLLKPQIEKSATQIHLSLPEGGIEVLADPIRLEQVVVNLLGNAMHAMEEVIERWIKVTAREQRGRLLITIHDHGPGIPPENLEQIFDPFFTTRKSGLGLGLAISQHIVENMGGVLNAENHPEGGAQFTIELDIAPAAIT